MIKSLTVIVMLLFLLPVSNTSGSDWITAPSYFTHDPATGERTNQYAPIGPFYTYSDPSFRRSGYRNTRSSIQVGTSADHYHTTEQWGDPVQPYGEWRHPYRPYSVPYDAWGPQLYGGFPFGRGRGGFGGGYPLQNGRGPNGVPGVGGPGIIQPVQPGLQRRNNVGPNPLQPGYSGQQQLLDGRYPPFERLGPFDRRQIFDHYYPPQQDVPQPQGAGN